MKETSIKNKIKVSIIFIIGAVLFFVHFYNQSPNKEFQVVNWDNYYNENNIAFFYEKNDNKKIEMLKSTYKIDEVIEKNTNELDKALKTVDILKCIVEVDDVSDLEVNSGYDILKEKGNNKKISVKNSAIIERDLLISCGFKSRVGVYRSKDAYSNLNSDYYVVEYWSNEKNKWIMIDFLDKGYFTDQDNILSAIEVIQKDFKQLSYIGETKEKEHKKHLKQYLDSYSIAIDNTIKYSKSNTYVTYIKNKEALEIKFKNKFAPPTIFTDITVLFEKNPEDTKMVGDKKAYIVLTKKNDLLEMTNDKQPTSNKSNEITMIVGAFKDGKIIDNYYLNINGKGYENINKYKEIKINSGENTIDLSLDGTNSISNVILRKN